jgi:endogenous inhibitor of DNA gyrase (YacG/DUF329 family)
MSREERERSRPERTARACPICGRPASPESYPFCSRRCADIDLNRWLFGGYVIPGAKDREAEDGGGGD